MPPPLDPSSMMIPLRVFSSLDKNTTQAQDRGPCQHCYDCRPDAKKMTTVSSNGVCVMCNGTGARLCSQCSGNQYCSVECQRADWPMHKLVCKPFKAASDTSRPSESHFRVLFFPHREMRPQFCWASTNASGELVVQHATIKFWRSSMKNRNSSAEPSDPLIIHALTGDKAMRGKVLGHALRVAYWQPPNGVTGHLEGFNETVLSLMSHEPHVGHRQYGPLVAFAYKLDSEYKYTAMDDMTPADLRHVVDWFHNSVWNPVLHDAGRYPEKSIPGLLIPDSTHLSSESCSQAHSIIDNVVKMKLPVLGVTIPNMLNSSQRCYSPFCSPTSVPAIMEMCPGGDIWLSFPLGPMLLGLPWIGRNAIITDIHNTSSRKQWPARRWNQTMARHLRQGAHLNRRQLTIQPYTMSDGLILYHERGLEINHLHVQAYNEFVDLFQKLPPSQRSYTKESFTKFWRSLQSGKVKSPTGFDRAVFKEAASPYDGFDDDEPASVLASETARQFGILTRLFRGQEIRDRLEETAGAHRFVVDPEQAGIPVPSEFAFHAGDWNVEPGKRSGGDAAPSGQVPQTQSADGAVDNEADDWAKLAAESLTMMSKQL